jgi:hypothetical protein
LLLLLLQLLLHLVLLLFGQHWLPTQTGGTARHQQYASRQWWWM